VSATRHGPAQAHVRLGHARFDATPPDGIYNRLWGAARHDRATGVHRQLAADLFAVGGVNDTKPLFLRLELDLCCLMQAWVDELRDAIAAAANVRRADVHVTFSHTHAAGWLFDPAKHGLPGGDLVVPYIRELVVNATQSAREAVAAMQEVWIAHGVGRCSLAANRDYWDDARGNHATGFNPDAAADDTVTVARATDDEGRTVATFVHYACHPTTLAWENSLISPDYVGAMRELVEDSTGAPCVFLQGACGELGPRVGFVGDTATADRNGRQLGHAALAVLESLDPPALELAYQGPIVSGATLANWRHEPISQERRTRAEVATGRAHTVDLPLKPKPDRATLEAELARWVASEQPDAHAMAERTRRWLARLDDLPTGPTLPFPFAVYRLGETLWITTAAEPYNTIQQVLRARFPTWTILLSPLAGDVQIAYLLPGDRYGKGLYQEEPSILAPGCLEQLTEAIAEQITRLVS
jgi:hypothetical protein